MSNLKKLMSFRENITHFKQDQIPEKDTIKEIIKDAHDMVPHKNNMWAYSIDVYGPEHADEKKRVAMQTVTGYSKNDFRGGGKDFDNVEKLENIYNKWIEQRKLHKFGPTSTSSGGYNGFSFNDQVTAPYLLVYRQRPGFPTKKQMEKGYRKRLIGYKDNMQWYISASMHGYGLSLLAAEKGLHASFCKCYFHSLANFTNILAPLKHGFDNIAFLLGIGYKDKGMPYKKNIKKPDIDEIVEWK
tara:strand:+ start:956 stop:1684 length:729 start_codon:yes stop_codon:yes gene_type:complete